MVGSLWSSRPSRRVNGIRLEWGVLIAVDDLQSDQAVEGVGRCTLPTRSVDGVAIHGGEGDGGFGVSALREADDHAGSPGLQPKTSRAAQPPFPDIKVLFHSELVVEGLWVRAAPPGCWSTR